MSQAGLREVTGRFPSSLDDEKAKLQDLLVKWSHDLGKEEGENISNDDKSTLCLCFCTILAECMVSFFLLE